MSDVVTFKLINGVDIIGKLNVTPDGRKGYEHIPNVIILDDALHIGINVMKGEDGQARAQVSFNPVAIPVEDQGQSRIGLSPTSVAFQYPIDPVYQEGYLNATSLIQLPPGGGGRVIV